MEMSIQKLFSVTEVDLMEVEGFTYRTAIVRERILTLPRELMYEFEEKLARLAGWNGRDNHTAYRLTEKYGERKTIYVSFSDQNVTFGTSIEKRSW